MAAINIRIGNRRFAPGLWPSLITVLLFPVLVALGCWQLDRAGQKRALYEQSVRHGTEAVLNLNSAGAVKENKTEMMWRHILATGQFDPGTQILLDNQFSNAGEPGYLVLTPFRLTGENSWFLVNRGWIPMGADRNVLPSINTPAEEITIQAVVTDVPVTGLFLGDKAIETLPDGAYRAQRIKIEEIAPLLKHDLLPYVLRLESDSPHGFVREWIMPGSGEEKHLGYAFQWFALAATLLTIYFFVNLKKLS